MSCVLPSVKTNKAENFVGLALPITADAVAGEIVRPVTRGGPTVKDELPVIEPEIADTVIAPGLNEFSKPVELIVATVESDVDHVTVASALVVPSENLPVAVNCCVRPAATDVFGAVTVIACKLTGEGFDPLALPPPPPQPMRATPSGTRMMRNTISARAGCVRRIRPPVMVNGERGDMEQRPDKLRQISAL